ncbi:MAG TPA: MFS transporter [Amycolatopsis sp.]|uniref:MFS transporter n=1 Tax=Amycolatopsis sp. TaxID=37632 RepID=UPI002B45C1F7|nr:MFS transporter [Amycolatopsis sp.]HKS46888.1 MFS transporter [Amycolatopsis sp.]
MKERGWSSADVAVSLPITGWLGRKVGVGRLWLGAFAAFTVASGPCALAASIGWLVASRVVQGGAAGLLVPAGQTILGQAVGPRRLGRVMSILGIAVSSGPAVGPTWARRSAGCCRTRCPGRGCS